MYDIPEEFARFMIELHEEEGRAWLARLPAILARCAERWDLTIGPPFAGLSFHYVAPAVRADGAHLVVKVASPTHEFAVEAAALGFFGGHGMAQLLESDAEVEALLLERLEPGTLLAAVEDDTLATSYATGVMRRLWRPVPPEHPFPTVSDWGKGFARLRQHYEGGTGPFPSPLVERAEALFAELAASMAEPVLLHGDLHHENILAAQREPWLAIDPKGLIGEPAYETGALLRNPIPGIFHAPDLGRILARRIDVLAGNLGMDRARIWGWGFAQAVLSAWWSVEDVGHVSEEMLALAEVLLSVERG